MTRLDRIIGLAALLAVFFLVAMVNITTPSDVGPLGVLVFFTLVYLVCFGVAVLLCRLFFGLRDRVSKGKGRVSAKRSYYYASVLAFAPMLLIFMRSFGGLNVLELVLVGLFVLVGCFYISKRA